LQPSNPQLVGFRSWTPSARSRDRERRFHGIRLDHVVVDPVKHGAPPPPRRRQSRRQLSLSTARLQITNIFRTNHAFRCPPALPRACSARM
jgi:hypothetical protein